MRRIKEIVERNDTRWGRGFDFFIQGLIVGSLASFLVETAPGLSERAYRILGVMEVITVGIFTIEYLLRIMAIKE